LATAQMWEGKRELAAATVRKATEVYEVRSEALARLCKELEEPHDDAAFAEASEERGEEFMAKRQYDLASGCYTKALDALGELAASAHPLKPMRLRILRRRAECAQQLQEWGACRRDSTEILEHDHADVAALLRRAAANEALEKFKEALDDARRLLAIDPRNSAANRIAHSCQQALRD